jgi:hypothetical protein
VNLEELAHEVGELAQRARLDAINLAVAAAKVKLSDPGFKKANERVIQLVTRATEVAGRVDRLTRQMAGQAQEDDVVDSGADTLVRLEACLREVEELSTSIVDEVRQLAARQMGARQPSRPAP